MSAPNVAEKYSSNSLAPNQAVEPTAGRRTETLKDDL